MTESVAVEAFRAFEAADVGAGIWVVEALGAFDKLGVVPRAETAGDGALVVFGKLFVGAGYRAGAVRLLEPATVVGVGVAGEALETTVCLGDDCPCSPSSRGNGSSMTGVDVLWGSTGVGAEGSRAGAAS